MAFPPLFEDFGKAANDLLDAVSFKNKLTLKNKSQDGVVVKTQISEASPKDCCADKGFKGTVAVTAKNAIKNGQIDAEAGTGCQGSVSLCSKDAFGILPDLSTTMQIGTDPFIPANKKVPAAGGCYFKDSFQYRYPNLSVTGAAKAGFQRNYSTIGNASASVGFEGFAVGVGAEFPIYQAQHIPIQVDGAFEYSRKDINAGVRTSDNHKNVRAYVWYQADNRTAAAAAIDYNLVDKNAVNVASLASSYVVSKNTLFHFKVDTKKVAGIKVTHNMADPSVQASFSSEVDVGSCSLKAKRFGVQLTVGDY